MSSKKTTKKKETKTAKKLLRLSLDDIYYVERIVGKRIDNGVVKYCVKWKDYDPKDNTWEPIDHLKRYECDELIQEYEDRAAKRELRYKDGKTVSQTDDTTRVESVSQLLEVLLESESDDNDNDTDNDNDNVAEDSIDSDLVNVSTAKPNGNDNDEISDTKTDETRTIEMSETGDEQQFDDIDCDMDESAEEVEETHKHKDRDDSEESDVEFSDDMLTELKRTVNGMNGLRRGIKPKKILGVSDLIKELCFIMTYEDSDLVDLVMASEANVACPDVVIDFYQSITVWKSRNEDNCSNQENRALNCLL